jgi:uncharacterized Zn finger protein/DNA-binding XRE family transcriptional regulator
MSRYSFYAPYVPVAERRRQAQEKLKKMSKKGMKIEPLGELTHRTKIATSFWGQRWCEHLESYSDFSNRLPRGRTYVRNGSVIHLAIRTGEIEALVQGSELYKIHVKISPLPPAKWKVIQTKCRGKIGSLIELLQGKISSEIMAIVSDQTEGLFPSPKEIDMDCSCPDWAGLCKHLAAVLYGVGARLDQQPELLFTLRGVDHNELISSSEPLADLTQTRATTRGRRRIASDNVDAVFGIELDVPEPAPPPPPPPPPPAPKKAPKAKPFIPTAANLRRLREESGLGKKAFARALGVSVPSIDNWEKQKGPLVMRDSNLEKLKAFAAQMPSA